MNSLIQNQIDISERAWWKEFPEAFELLLKDQTTKQPIFWATDNYELLGEGYRYSDPIEADKIAEAGKECIIRPRVLKTKAEQLGRTREMAEVFTPAWICNLQNNLIDEAWFGRKDVFNIEDQDTQTWQATTDPITFPEGKTWQNYVSATRLEITCGEAPYMVSRYDATTGQEILLSQRIGMLDRKLRVISENTKTSDEWLEMAQVAYKHCYAYEWQGDSLLLAREAFLASFIDYYEEQFNKQTPPDKAIKAIAEIISWNVWQMDGLRGVVPGSCGETVKQATELFGDEMQEPIPCTACQDGKMHGHNGIYCMIQDWDEGGAVKKFVDLLPINSPTSKH